jgi:hypothetical protein
VRQGELRPLLVMRANAAREGKERSWVGGRMTKEKKEQMVIVKKLSVSNKMSVEALVV